MIIGRKILKYCIYIGAILLFNGVNLFAQSRARQDLGEARQLYEDLFSSSALELFISSNVTTKAKVKHQQEAKYQLSTLPQISFEFGIQKLTPISTELGLLFGLHLGIVGRNANYILPGSEIGYQDSNYVYPFTGPIGREKDLLYLSAPVMLEYRILKNRQHFWFFHGGLNARIASFNGVTEEDMEIMHIGLKGNPYPYINFNGGGGIGFLLKNLDIIKIGVIANYDPFYVAKGDFYLSTNSSLDYGEYKVKGTYIGLSAVYTRTKSYK